MLDLAVTPLVLTGREVILEPLELEHVEALALAAAESRDHYRWNPVPDGVPAARQYVERAARARIEGRRLPFVIRFRSRVVGTTSYSDFQPWEWPAGSPEQRSDRPDALEIGYTWLAASAQRTRCNTEAKYLLLAHAFEHWQVHRVSFRTDERNQRSRRAIARLGAAFEGIRRGDKPGTDGTLRHSAFYSILRSEWPGVREHLQALLEQEVADAS
jgi:RimJ/RimL family protein N-acetyltransferase